jgi:hypothetical protein
VHEKINDCLGILHINNPDKSMFPGKPVFE